MILLETTIVNGALSADWTLAISFGVIGFLLVAIATMVARHYINTLNGIEKSLEKIDSRVTELEKFSIETRFNLDKNNDTTERLERETERIHNEMMTKLKIMHG